MAGEQLAMVENFAIVNNRSVDETRRRAGSRTADREVDILTAVDETRIEAANLVEEIATDSEVRRDGKLLATDGSVQPIRDRRQKSPRGRAESATIESAADEAVILNRTCHGVEPTVIDLVVGVAEQKHLA